MRLAFEAAGIDYADVARGTGMPRAGMRVLLNWLQHDTHHPISGALYDEDQQAEAQRCALDFRINRRPKYLTWFEAILDRNKSNGATGKLHLVGSRKRYADLSLFQLIAGCRYAFLNATRAALDQAAISACRCICPVSAALRSTRTGSSGVILSWTVELPAQRVDAVIPA